MYERPTLTSSPLQTAVMVGEWVQTQAVPWQRSLARDRGAPRSSSSRGRGISHHFLGEGGSELEQDMGLLANLFLSAASWLWIGSLKPSPDIMESLERKQFLPRPCTALHCNELHCTILYCTALH